MNHYSGTGNSLSSNRFYVQRGIHADFIEGVKKNLKNHRQSNGLTSDMDLGPLTDESAYGKVADQVSVALSIGAVLKYRGVAPDTNPDRSGGYFYLFWRQSLSSWDCKRVRLEKFPETILD